MKHPGMPRPEGLSAKVGGSSRKRKSESASASASASASDLPSLEKEVL